MHSVSPTYSKNWTLLMISK